MMSLIKEGKLKVMNDKVYPFSETPAAVKDNLGGRTTGKILIKL